MIALAISPGDEELDPAKSFENAISVKFEGDSKRFQSSIKENADLSDPRTCEDYRRLIDK